MSEVEVTQVNPNVTDPIKVTQVDVGKVVKETVEPEVKSEEVDNKEPIQEDVKTPDKEESKEDEVTSARFAALSKREKEVVRREQEAKKSLERAKYIEENFERFKKSPKTVLNELGLDFETFTKSYLDELDGKEPEKKVEDFIKEIDEKHESKWKKYEEQQAQLQEQQQKEIIDNYKAKIKADLTTEEAKTKYELVNVKGAYDVVYGVIHKHFQDTLDESGNGEILTIEEAADLVEKHFEEEAETYMKAQKLASKYKPEIKEEKKSFTLSNKSAGGALSNDHSTELSRLSKTDESKKKAAARLKWT